MPYFPATLITPIHMPHISTISAMTVSRILSTHHRLITRPCNNSRLLSSSKLFLPTTK